MSLKSKAQSRVNIGRAFRLGEQDLRRIHRLLLERVGPVEIEAFCADEIQRTFPSLESLMEFNNPQRQAIQRISLQSQSEDFSKIAAVQFADRSDFPISVDLTAPEDLLLRLRESVFDVISGTKPWYWVFTKLNFGLIYLLSTFIVGLSAVTVHSQFMNRPLRDWGYLTWVPAAVIIVFTVLANFLREKFFPVGEFLIGQGKGRYDFREKMRWLLVSVVLSVLLGLPMWLLKVVVTRSCPFP